MKHSKLGASGAHRWMPCPGSVSLAKPLGREEESDYALEGTAGHKLLSDTILKGIDPHTRLGEKISVTSSIGNVSEWEVTQEMVEAIDLVVNDIKTTHPNPARWGAETAFHEPKVHELFYGTCDFWAVEGTTLYITDFKYGAGLVVEVQNNPQLMYYALGALWSLGEMDACPPKIENIVVKIIQPRVSHSGGAIRQWGISLYELLAWGQDELVPAMNRAMVSDELASGEWCRFCPCLTRSCPQVHQDGEEFLRLVKIMEEIRELTNDEIARAKGLMIVIDMAGKKISGLAFSRLQAGQRIPGWKLVKSKTKRVLREGAATMARLLWGDAVFTEPALKGPADFDKMPGGKKFTAQYAYKPDAGLTVAKESDPRTAISIETKSLFTGETK